MNRVVLILSVALGILLCVSDATAQKQTIEVKDGVIFVDGKALSPASSSEHLLRGLDAHIVAPPNTTILFEVDGSFFRVSALGAEEMGRPLFPLSQVSQRRSQADAERGVPREEIFIVQQAEELRARAREMERIGVQLQSERVPDSELFKMIETLRRSAMEAEQVARALPHFRAQGYLSEVREQNVELYERLVREQRLEEESIRLSTEIRALGDTADRDVRINQLRDRLEEIFQIKQENRQHEIEELEARLVSMQKRLEKRERYHDYIIERRLNQLIGSQGETAGPVEPSNR